MEQLSLCQVVVFNKKEEEEEEGGGISLFSLELTTKMRQQ